MDKTAEVEQRLNSLEDRLKLVFAEIENRLDQAKPHEEYTPEERIQEIEDLLLLLQLETAKIKEKVGDTTMDFGIAPIAPDIVARLSRVEEELGHVHNAPPAEGNDAKIAQLEEKIKALEEFPAAMKDEQFKELEKRIRTLEALMERRGKKEIEEAESNLLNDIQNILRH